MKCRTAQPSISSTFNRRILTRLAVFCLAVSLPAIGQNTNGRILGIVTDPQGAALAGAKVTVANAATNVQRTTVTDGTGSYQVLDLPIGTYVVTVDMKGFTKAIAHPPALEINQSLRVDIAMKVGGTTEVVQVESQSSQVETVNPTIGGTVTGKPIQDLPLNGREVLDLAVTQPGVLPAPTNSAAYGSEKSGSFAEGFTVAGGRPDAVTYLLDGGLNNSVTSNNVVFDPNPDAVDEFRILTNNYTAEYGRNGGGTVTVVTKSGTNDLHGSLFEYLRNDDFNANDYFDKEFGQPRPVLKRNQFGGTFGGPIIKDRLFYFFGYQGQRQVSVFHGQAVTTYTPAELNGDFSQAVNGAPDPNVVAYLQEFPYFQSNPALAAQGIMDPTKIDPVAQAYIKAGLVPTSPSGQLFPKGTASDNVDQYTGKLDFYATANDRLSLTIGSNQEPELNPLVGATVAGFPANISTTNQFLNLAYTKTFSSSLLNEAHATAQRFYQTSSAASHPHDRLPHALLLPACRHAREHQRRDRRSNRRARAPRGEGRRQDLRPLSGGWSFPSRAKRAPVLHPHDVDGPDLRHHLGAVRAEPRDRDPESVLRSGRRRHRHGRNPDARRQSGIRTPSPAAGRGARG